VFAIDEAITLWLNRDEADLETDIEINNRSYEAAREELFKKYKGKFVIIAEGKLVGVYGNLDDASKELRALRPHIKHAILTKVGYDEKYSGEYEWWGGSISCIEYLKGKKHPAPALKLTIYNVRRKIIEDVKAPMDTGYEGSVMLTAELYQALQMAELPRSLWRNYRTLTSTITMRMARAIIETNDTEFECFVESQLLGRGKLLIGRELSNRPTMNSSQNYLGLLAWGFALEFRELSDVEWAFIQPLPPPRAGTGGPGLTMGWS